MVAGRWHSGRLRNSVQSGALLGAMAGLLALLGALIAGTTGTVLALTAGVALVLLNPATSPGLVLRLNHARPLPRRIAPRLHAALEDLAGRAGLPAAPALFLVPHPAINAFTVGTPDRAAIGVTEGFLATLDLEEATGVLAHEVSHLENNDLWVMGLAQVFARLTETMSLAGQILVVLSLPGMLSGAYAVNWVALLVLVFAPGASVLLGLALSRVREYAADLRAAHLCGTPRPLARALVTIERRQGGFLERLLGPGRGLEPAWLRTHPATQERVRRLLALSRDETGLREPDPRRVVRRPGYFAVSGHPTGGRA